MRMRREIIRIFSEVFGGGPGVSAFAPGRVNLIGEHTDYNGGFVLPCALNLGIYGAARLRDDNSLRLYSANFKSSGVTELTIDSLCAEGWAAYPTAVFKAFSAMGYKVDRGADFAFFGDLPDGSGLSSSAALEVLTGLLLKELYGFSVTPQELAVFGQFAENRFIGVNCGIMDQFASAMGRSGSAVLLNSATLEYSYAPFDYDSVSLALINSGVKHSLASSAYNDRRRECEAALADINEVKKTPALCSLTAAEFESCKSKIKSPVCQRRASHAVYENQRTIQAAEALKNGDLSEFGRLMRESHLSLKYDYEVSCAELDFLAQTAWDTDGVIGARMTGGGFGGCTVNLVKKESLDSFVKTITEKYKNKFAIPADVYAVKIGGGAFLTNEVQYV